MSPEPSTSTQNHEVCVDCTILQEDVTRNNQQIQCLQNQLNTTKIENQYLQASSFWEKRNVWAENYRAFLDDYLNFGANQFGFY